MNNKDIVIIGDSFCANRYNNCAWPYVLTTMLTGVGSVPRGSGFSGAAWWSTRQLLLKELENPPQILVLCHTQQDRLQSDYNLGFNTGVALNLIPVMGSDDPEVAKAVKYYYKYLHSFKYHEWAMLSWFKELDTLVKDIPKVIHLPCFELSWGEYIFKNGITVYPCLNDFVIEENTTEPIINHFTKQQNLELAKLLHHLITDYTPGVVRHHKFQLL